MSGVDSDVTSSVQMCGTPSSHLDGRSYTHCVKVCVCVLSSKKCARHGKHMMVGLLHTR
ncbi:hypothetical protein J6590_019005 [Homalodisca vitripennis]|nr:hypothetical protein J6590_019005 [Homalodisca vitripennis]